MGEVLTIYQYQSVVFNSTTTGATPIALAWDFPGGLPTTGTGTSQTVLYNVPGDYSVVLTATDHYGTTSSLTETNIIRVNPTTVTPGISGPTPSIITMNEGYNLYDNSTGNPYPAISWNWSLPYGVTASTQNVGVTGYIDWYTLTGTYSGDPGSSYIAPISLTVNNGYTPATASTTVEVQKMGPAESIYLNATGPSSVSYVTGLTGGILTNPPSGVMPEEIQNLGYPGTGGTAFAFHLDTKFRYTSALDIPSTFNKYFHSTEESAAVLMTTGFYSDMYNDVINGFLIVNGPTYTTYSTMPVNSGISSGEYIIQNQAYDFYIANYSSGAPGLLSEVYYNKNYTVSLINYLLRNPYKLAFSGNIQYSNTGAMNPMTFIDLGPAGGTGDNNPAVYSSSYLVSKGVIGSPIYQVYISATIGGFPYGATATFGTLGSTGNDPLTNGNFYVAQDNSNGVGFVKILNTAINASSIPGGTGTIVFEAQSFFNCDYSSPTGPHHNPNNYNGVALKILKNNLVQTVVLSDNSNSLSSPSFKVAPFTADSMNPQGSTETCSGLFSNPMVVMSGTYNILNIGGGISYP